MLQLTPDFDRIVVPSHGMDINTLDVIISIQTIMEIRISEDYCRCDIYVVDFGGITFCHITKIANSMLTKFELCDLVRSTYDFFVYKDNIS